MKTQTIIAAAASVSSVIDIRRHRESIGFMMPAALTRAAMTFTGATKSDDTFRAVKDDAGNAISVTIAVDEAISLTEANNQIVMSFNYLKLIPTGGAEAAERIIGVVLK